MEQTLAKKKSKKTISSKINDKQKKHWNMYSILGLISDILIYPVIIVSLFSTFSMIASKTQGKVQKIFGYGIVKVLSGSMIKVGEGDATGFNVNDCVFVKEKDANEYRVNDVVAFYRYVDQADSKAPIFVIDATNPPPITGTGVDFGDRKTVADVVELKVLVIFHQIKEIRMNADGTRFFETKGTSNSGADSEIIREDFIVGKYVFTPKWARDVFQFCTTPVGMITLVVVPLTVLITMQLLSLLEQVSALVLEKKVLTKKIAYYAEECIESNVGTDMRLFDKAFFYDIMPKKQKADVEKFLWGAIKSNKLEQYEFAKETMELYAINPDAFWNHWINHSIGINKRRFIKARAHSAEVIYNEKLAYKKRLIENQINGVLDDVEEYVVEAEQKKPQSNFVKKVRGWIRKM
ncbi:MAG: hypothetical protein RR140_00430 [Clostridia bacterium]